MQEQDEVLDDLIHQNQAERRLSFEKRKANTGTSQPTRMSGYESSQPTEFASREPTRVGPLRLRAEILACPGDFLT